MSDAETDAAEQTGGSPGALEEIRGFAERFVEEWRLDLSAAVRVERDALIVDLSGRDADLLLENRAETLEALQVIFGKILPSRFGTTLRILVDCGSYRQGRENEIVEIAHRTAERVKKFGEAASLSPMNPYERRLVHLALKDDAGVFTASDGDGYMKRVRISLKPPDA